MKRIVSIILSFMLLISLFSLDTFVITADAATSGTQVIIFSQAEPWQLVGK